MGWQYTAQQVAEDAKKFVQETADRWSIALGDIGTGTYTSKAFQADVVNTITNSITRLWLPLLGFLNPALPVATVRGTVGDVTTAPGVRGFALLDTPFDTGSLTPKSTLVMEGNPSVQVNCDLAEITTQQVRVTVLLPSSPAPTPGTYHGVASASVGGTAKTIAMILLTIT